MDSTPTVRIRLPVIQVRTPHGARRLAPGEALISAALLSIYTGSRGAAFVITVAQTGPTLCAGAAAKLSHCATGVGGMRRGA